MLIGFTADNDCSYGAIGASGSVISRSNVASHAAPAGERSANDQWLTGSLSRASAAFVGEPSYGPGSTSGGSASEAAEAAVAKAKTDAVTHLVDTAAGRAGEAPVTVRDARRAAEDSGDELETLRAATIALEAGLHGLHDSGTFRKLAVDRAIAAVVAASLEAAELVVRVGRLQHALHDAGAAALRLLAAKGSRDTFDRT